MANQEHRRAVDELVADPGNTDKAQRVFDSARGDPQGAQEAREQLAPAPPLIPLDLQRVPFQRHNLHMPQAPEVIETPNSLQELVNTVQRAATDWSPVKAIGDGYGFANTGETKGYLLPMVERMNRVLELDASVLSNPAQAANLCRFEGGATIQTLNEYLWPRRKALLNQPGYERLTYVGTMSSGGHGSGTWCGPLSDHVRALHIVTVNDGRRVVQVQIEPRTNALSEPTKFKAKYPDIQLVQDDELFHACTVSMGCLGVVYSATIEVRDAYNVLETRRAYRFNDLKRRLPVLLAEQGPQKRLHSIEVWVNPYEVDGNVWCVLGERAETTDKPRGERSFVIEHGGPEFLFRLLSWFLAHHPKAVPALVHSAMLATQSGEVVLEAPQALNFGAVNLAPVIAASCAVPSEGIADLCERLITFFQDRAQRDNLYITSPMGLRFVKSGSAHLSPQSGRDTCMIEVPTLLGTPRARDTLNAYHDFLADACKGRPHWGQINDMPGARLAKLYGQARVDAFQQAFRVLNPIGVFDNAFTEQMKFRS